MNLHLSNGRNMKLSFRILFIFLTLASGYSYAGCSNLISSATLNFGNVIVQRDAPSNSAVSGLIYGVQQDVATCVDPGGTGVANGIVSVLNTAGSYNGNAVFNTSLNGIGISMGLLGGFYAGQYDKPMLAGTTFTSEGWSSGPPTRTWTYQPYIQFVKTAALATSGYINQQIAYYRPEYGSTNFMAGVNSGVIPLYISGTVTVVACSISTPNLTFPIGDVPVSSFGSTVGTTPAVAQNTQNLGLNCDVGANINVSLSGTQNPDISDSSVLALTGQGGAGVAKGVGVQIVYNGAPLMLNNRIVLKTSSGGQETFPLTARYYQTRTTVSTGTANASATLNLTYQ